MRILDKIPDVFPKHPTGEKKATWFHTYAALICLAHLPVVLLGTWYHVVGAIRHYRDMKSGRT